MSSITAALRISLYFILPVKVMPNIDFSMLRWVHCNFPANVLLKIWVSALQIRSHRTCWLKVFICSLSNTGVLLHILVMPWPPPFLLCSLLFDVFYNSCSTNFLIFHLACQCYASPYCIEFIENFLQMFC